MRFSRSQKASPSQNGGRSSTLPRRSSAALIGVLPVSSDSGAKVPKECYRSVSALAFLWTLPALDRDLARAPDCQLITRRILRDRGACADRRSGFDPHGRYEHAARADEDAVLDMGRPFVGAVVVARDGAGADVHIGAHDGITEVGEVVRLAADAELRVLQLHEVADVDVRREYRSGTNPREGTDAARRSDHGVVDHAVSEDLGVIADDGVADDASWADADTVAEPHPAFENDVHIEQCVAAD